MRPVRRSLPMALMRAREAVMSHFRPILASHDLTEQQWRVLRVLVEEPDGLEVGALAQRTFLLGPSLSRILVTLQGKELVTKRPVATDGRRSLVSTTARGAAIVDALGPLSEEVYRHLEATMGNERMALLYELLDEMWAAASSE